VTSVASIVRGAGAVRRAWRVWLLAWALAVAFALLVALPAAGVLSARLGHSLYAGALEKNFDLQWLAEFRNETGNWPLAAARPALALIFAGYLLVATFVSGGALAVFAGDAAGFWPGAARYFWRMVRLLLASLAFYAVIFGIDRGLAAVGNKLWGQGMAERPVVLFTWLRAAIALLLVLFVNMTFDYARIRLVAEDRRHTLAAVRAALRFVASRPGVTIATYALLTALAAALAAGYWLLAGAIPLVLVVLLQQAFAFWRVGLKLEYLAAQMEVWRRCGTTEA
jgi:hypothetical protein